MNFSVVILSKTDENLNRCLAALYEHEPSLGKQDVVVVNDGLEREHPCQMIDGEKPFIFARNANLGINHAGRDVVLMNDDALLETDAGLSSMVNEARKYTLMGMCSAVVDGVVNNARQKPSASTEMRFSNDRSVAFVCVYIPWKVYKGMGPLDERFTGYGYDDTDYWMRCVQAGLTIGIWDGCMVNHQKLPSTYRTMKMQPHLFQHNKALFSEKWGKA